MHHDIPMVLSTPTVLKITHTALMTSPTVLNTPTVLKISPMVPNIPTVLKISPHMDHDIPHGTEHHTVLLTRYTGYKLSRLISQTGFVVSRFFLYLMSMLALLVILDIIYLILGLLILKLRSSVHFHLTKLLTHCLDHRLNRVKTGSAKAGQMQNGLLGHTSMLNEHAV